jgi:hypothetical protein
MRQGVAGQTYTSATQYGRAGWGKTSPGIFKEFWDSRDALYCPELERDGVGCGTGDCRRGIDRGLVVVRGWVGSDGGGSGGSAYVGEVDTLEAPGEKLPGGRSGLGSNDGVEGGSTTSWDGS